MPMVMEKKDWMQTVANVGTADGVWFENVAGDAGDISVSLPEGGSYQVILVKVGARPDAQRAVISPSLVSSRGDVSERERKQDADEAMSRLKALVKKTSKHLHGEAYVFNRADAYEPETPYA